MTTNTTFTSYQQTIPRKPPLLSGISDLHLSLLIPVVVHWTTSAVFEICERTGWLQQYRLHTTTDELKKNRVTRLECFLGTLKCQILQTLLGLLLASFGEDEVLGDEEYELAVWIHRVHIFISMLPSLSAFTGVDVKAMAVTLSESRVMLPLDRQPRITSATIEILLGKFLYNYFTPAFQIIVALIVADACMYCLHRLEHTNQWLYKHIHSHHHRLYVPYSWGASYNHPFDSLMLDGMSYGIGCSVAGISTRASIILFAYSSFKNILDHCGYQFPWNPIRAVTGVDPSFHDVHHQRWGLKSNFGAHLAIWDQMMGTHFSDEDEVERLRRKNRVVD